MKSKEVLELLQITRPTLIKYVQNGNIKITKGVKRVNSILEVGLQQLQGKEEI